MSTQTPAPTAPDTPAAPAGGLRERKKRLMRQQLSDTATRMFVDRGFDAVRVAEVAAACGVSEKTVFNYFPTKESLVLDRLETTMASLRTGLTDPTVPPVQAALAILDGELAGLTAWLAGQDDSAQAARAIRRFGDLIRATPSLRAYQADMMGQFVSVAAEILAARAGVSPDDPEPQIAARALLGLWHVQADSLRKHLDGSLAPARIHELVTGDVRRAARLIEAGLHSFAPVRPTLRKDAPLHGVTCPLSLTATSSSISAISTALTSLRAPVTPTAWAHPDAGPAARSPRAAGARSAARRLPGRQTPRPEGRSRSTAARAAWLRRWPARSPAVSRRRS
jgi:AcrR family transcriptional regulator